MKRSDVLALLRVAGYHNDTASFLRLYTENRVSLAAAKDAFGEGARQKEWGVKCGCYSCRRADDTRQP